MNYLHINVELPFQFDKQFEPIVPNENLISKFAALVDLDEVTAKKISCAFKKNSVFEKSLYGADVSGMHLLHFFAYDDGFTNFVKNTVGSESIFYLLKKWSAMHCIFYDFALQNTFYRHQINERCLFVGSNNFIADCRLIVNQSNQEFDSIAMGQMYDDDDITEARNFICKYENNFQLSD